MSKRFTATEKWRDPWFLTLCWQDKLFWIYLLDNCDHAGIWQVYWPEVSLKIYYQYAFHLENFEGRIVQYHAKKWWIPKFIEFQYGTLNEDNRAHFSVISILKREGLYKLLARTLQGPMDKDKDKDKEKKGGMGENKPDLNDVIAYCKERGKGVDPSQWFDFYESKGWMIGKNKMKDWKAAVRTWEKNSNGIESKPKSEPAYFSKFPDLPEPKEF